MKTATAVALSALALAALGTPSQAAAKWVIKGHGFGHGIGMSQYGAYGLRQARPRLPPDPPPLLRPHRDRSGRGRLDQGPAHLGGRLGVVLGRAQVLRARDLAVEELPLRDFGLRRGPPERRRQEAEAVRGHRGCEERRRDLGPGPGDLQGRAARRGAVRIALHRQPGRHRGLRPGRDPERDALELGPAGPPRPGGGRPLLRPGDGARRRLRRLRRHPQPGLRGQGNRDSGHELGRQAHGRRGAEERREDRGHLLLLHLRRAHREHRELLRRLGPRRLPEGGERPLRRHLAGP